MWKDWLRKGMTPNKCPISPAVILNLFQDLIDARSRNKFGMTAQLFSIIGMTSSEKNHA